MGSCARDTCDVMGWVQSRRANRADWRAASTARDDLECTVRVGANWREIATQSRAPRPMKLTPGVLTRGGANRSPAPVGTDRTRVNQAVTSAHSAGDPGQMTIERSDCAKAEAKCNMG